MLVHLDFKDMTEVTFVSSGSGLLTFPDPQVFLHHLSRLACLCVQSAHSDGF